MPRMKNLKNIVNSFTKIESSRSPYASVSQADLDDVIDARVMHALNLVIITLVPLGFVQVYAIGQQYGVSLFLYLTLTGFLGFPLLFTFRSYLRLPAYTYLFLACAGVTACAGFAAFGTFAEVYTLVSLFPFMAFFFTPVRQAFIASFLFFCCIVAISYGYATGSLAPAIDGLSYPQNIWHWLRVDLFTVAISTIFAIAGTSVRRNLVSSIKIISQQASEIEEQNWVLEDILANIAETYYRIDPDGNFLLVSQSCLDLVGYSSEELIGQKKAVEFFNDPADHTLWLKDLEENSGFLRNYKVTLRHRQGRSVLASTSAQYAKDKAGKLIGVEGTIHDITEETRQRDKIAEQDREILAILDTVPDTYIKATRDGKLVTVSPSVKRLLGYDSEELIGKEVQSLFTDPNLYPFFLKELDKSNRISNLTNQLLRKDGSTIWTDSSVTHWEDAGGTPIGIQAFVHDSTPLVTALDQASRNEKELSNILDSMLDVFFKVEMSGQFQMVSRSIEGTCGFSKKKVMAMTLFDLFADPKQGANFFGEVVRLGEFQASGAELRHKSGKLLVTNINARTTLDDNGEIVGIEGIIHDITNLRELEENTRKAQRFEALGRLTGGIAHDFNNLLGTISAKADLGKILGSTEGSVKLELLDDILKDVERGATLTKQLLAFSRKQALAPTVLNINQLLKDRASILNRAFSGSINEVRFDLDDTEPRVFIDSEQFTDTILHVLLNASDAMPDGGIVTISTRVEISKEHLGDSSEANAKSKKIVNITITDTGIGMSQTAQARAIDPFFTTKRDGHTGMGLSSVYGFMTQSGGQVKIDSQEGVGTSVHLLLPIADESNVVTDEVARITGEAMPGSTQARIVYVEDNLDLREVTLKYLEKIGHQVTCFETAPEGWEYINAGNEFDVLLTDVVLPGSMDGVELARKVVALKPDMPVIFVTGYSDERLNLLEPVSKSQSVLRKPYKFNDLAGRVENCR